MFSCIHLPLLEMPLDNRTILELNVEMEESHIYQPKNGIQNEIPYSKYGGHFIYVGEYLFG